MCEIHIRKEILVVLNNNGSNEVAFRGAAYHQSAPNQCPHPTKEKEGHYRIKISE